MGVKTNVNDGSFLWQNKESSTMKEVKAILLVIYTALYTSLIWACATFNWIPISVDSGDPFYLGAFLFIICTFFNMFGLGWYIFDHWND